MYYTRYVAVFASVSFASSVILLLLACRTVSEKPAGRVNILFALFCLAAAYVSFVELFLRLAESGPRAQLWANAAVAWPIAPALFLHFSLVLAVGNRPVPIVAVAATYCAAAVMAVLYYDFVQTGKALVFAYGYSLRSPLPAPWPYWLVTAALTALYAASFISLLVAGRRSSRLGGRRQIRWILGAYSVGLIVPLAYNLVGSTVSPTVPELTGLAYAVFAVGMFLGMFRRSITLLTPKSTAEYIVKKMNDLIILTDEDGTVVSANDSLRRYLPNIDARGRTFSQLFHDTGAHPLSGDVSVHTEWGERRLSFAHTQLYTRSGKPLGRVFIGRDVTEDRKREAHLQASLREKEALLREVHHRVNNSLQLVISILDLKTDRIDDARARSIIFEVTNRIRLIARIYEEVYAERDVTRISLDELIQRIVSSALSGYPNGSSIRAHYDLDAIVVDVQIAIPVAIVVAELVSNSMTHAFAGREGGAIHAELQREDENGFRIVIADDGVGFRSEDPPAGQGLRIVKALCGQIGVELSIERCAGTRCVLRKENGPPE